MGTTLEYRIYKGTKHRIDGSIMIPVKLKNIKKLLHTKVIINEVENIAVWNYNLIENQQVENIEIKVNNPDNEIYSIEVFIVVELN